MQVQQLKRGSFVLILKKVTSLRTINLEKNLIQNQRRFSDVDRRLRNLLWTSWFLLVPAPVLIAVHSKCGERAINFFFASNERKKQHNQILESHVYHV